MRCRGFVGTYMKRDAEGLICHESCRSSRIFGGADLVWQGHQDLNPGPTVLETAALPTELYPYDRVWG